MDDEAGFRFRWFGDAGCGSALQSGFNFHHSQYNRLGQLDADRLAIKKFHLNLKVWRQVIDRIAEGIAREMRLLVVFRVHEVVVITVAVEELHVLFIDVHLLDGIGGTETVLKHGSGAKVAQFRLYKGTQISWRAVLYAEHGMQIIVVLDDHAGTELGGWNRHCSFTSPYIPLGF